MKKIKFFLTFCLFILVPIFVSARNLPRVLISEVYYNPDESHKIQNKEGWFEWIEIINIDDTPVDLNGWKICDSNSCDVLTHSVFLVYPQEKVLILPTSTILNFWPNISSSTKQIVLESPIGGWGLNDNGERITLINQDGEIIDELCYGEARECTNLCPAIPEGYSLERNFLIDGPRCQFFLQSAPNPGTHTFEKYWHKFIFDPLEEVPLDIFSGFLLYGEEDEILSFLPTEHPIPLGCKILVGRTSWKNSHSSELVPYSGVGIKLENLTTHEIYLLSYEISSFSQYLLYSPDNGSSWEIIDDASFFIYFLDSPEILYFGVNLDELSSSLNWKINFISGSVDPYTFKYEIFDQTKEILLKENQPPIPIINYFPKNPVKGVKVKFDASSSTDPDGEIQEFFWEIKRGEEILATSTATTTTFVFSENGQYQIILTVTDNDGTTSSTSTTIKVEPFSFAIITDVHIGRHYREEYEGQDYYLTERLKRVVKWINENKDNVKCGNETCPIKFLAVLGDITENTPLVGFCKVKEILDQLQIPYVPVFGNHDVGTDEEFEREKRWKGQDYFDQVFWSKNSIPCQNASSTKNFELLLNELNFQRDEMNKDYKNFSFSFGGINFIGLDFVSRDHVPVGYGVNPEAVALKEECATSVPTGTTCPQLIKNEQENLNWLKKKLEESKGEPTIIFSHHPFKIDFTQAFTEEEIKSIKAIIENKNVLLDLAGHIHGWELFLGLEKLPGLEKLFFFDANKEYPSVGTTQVLTTEAAMVGSNDENPKGIIRVIKVFGSNEINYNNWETNIDGTEFIAFNPTVDFEYSGEKTGCIFFVAHAFTKKQNYTFIWDFGDGNFGSGKEAHHCYSRPGDYEATLIAKDKNSNFEEKITRKIKIKEEAIYPRIIKIKEKAKEKIELIWSSLGKNATEFGRTMKDWVLIKVKHSPSTPVGAIFVRPEKAKEDIDLNELKADYDLEKRKSILYMPEWPETVERSKILFIPR
jgi:PKD repeat protein